MKEVYEIFTHKAAYDVENLVTLNGPYIHANTSSGYYNEEKLSLAIDINKFDDQHFKNNVDFLYRLPHISLSRDKLAIYQEKANFKVIRDKDKADIIVISEKYLEKVSDRKWTSVIDKATALKILEKGIKLGSHIEDMHAKILNANNDSVFCFENNYGHLSANFKNIARDLFDFCDIISQSTTRRYVSCYKDVDQYNWLVLNSNKMIFDIELNKLCTSDSVKLTPEDFERLEELLKSEDEENRSVALSLMANCDMEGSKTYLALLFAFYSDNMKRNKVWTTVNFNALKKEFDNYIYESPTNWGHAYDNLIKKLVKNEALTLYASRYVANKMFIGVLQNNFGVGNNATVFTISSEAIQLKDEYKDKLIDLKDESKVISNLVSNGGHSMANDLDLPF